MCASLWYPMLLLKVAPLLEVNVEQRFDKE